MPIDPDPCFVLVCCCWFFCFVYLFFFLSIQGQCTCPVSKAFEITGWAKANLFIGETGDICKYKKLVNIKNQGHENVH